MLGYFYTLVDDRTECKRAGGTSETPIKDVWGIHVTGVARRRARRARPLKDTRASAGAHAPVGVLAGLSGGDEAPVAHRFAGDHDFKPRNNPRRAIRGPSYAPDSG